MGAAEVARSAAKLSAITASSEVAVAPTDAPTPPVPWDVEHYRRIAPLTGHVGLVWSERFVRDGREILPTGGGGTVRSWDAATGRPLRDDLD